MPFFTEGVIIVKSIPFSPMPTNWLLRNSLPLKICLISGTVIVVYQILQAQHNISISNRDEIYRISSNETQHGLITPMFLQFNHVQILDFVVYNDPVDLNKLSIFFSGFRFAWKWSEIYCLFRNSNLLIRGIIDRRSVEPFVVCPVPYLERKLILSNSPQVIMSIHINDTNFPNISFVSPSIAIPVYQREQHTVSVYTMLRDQTHRVIEWIEYHLMIGIEHFYLYDHLSSDSLDSFLQPYLEKNIVTIVRWPYQPLKDHHWNMVQSAAMNHALKNFGPFNKWMGYFDVDEYFQIKVIANRSIGAISLFNLLDQQFPEDKYPGGVQFETCPISCFVTQTDFISSRYSLLFEKCRNIEVQRDCRNRQKLFIRPRGVPIMHNIHALELGIVYADSSTSASFAEFRHYNYGIVTSDLSRSGKNDTSMDLFIKDLKQRVLEYRKQQNKITIDHD